jgi:predicted P-loop ATPase
MSAGPDGAEWLPAPEETPLVLAPDDNSDWRNLLLRGCARKIGDSGPILAVLANAITALRRAPEWSGVLAFNDFSLGTVGLRPAPWGGNPTGGEWTDHEDRLTADWLQHVGILVSVEVAGQAVQTVAKDLAFHPVRDYLDSLKWDGKKRIDTWLNLYLGTEVNDYTAAVGARWLTSAVARIYEPGAKADCCLILEGLQGLKKSTALKTIAGEWFTDEIADLGTKDAAMQTRGVWIIEIAELDSMSKSEVSKIKSFMSRSTDRFRPPYSKRLIESPRQCVFAGSVNHSDYLRDETGGRRFWPVRCSQIRIDELAHDRDLLWAEARVRYHSGAPWWLDSVDLNRLAQQEQADRYNGDPWDEVIENWLLSPSQRFDGTGHPLQQPFTSDLESVTIADVLNHCIGRPQNEWSQGDKTRVARCLRSLGFERHRARNGAVREWRYRRVST